MGKCYSRGEPFDPGAVLDAVVASTDAADKCCMYQLANFKKGGQLVEAFNKGGSKEVERFIKEKLGVFMYNHGRGEFITRTEYLRWKFRDNKKVIIGEKKKKSKCKYDPLLLWEDHEACWKMQYRGALGESLLHILIICDTLVHTRIARILLKCFPRSAIDKIEGEEYLGATGLHLAIAYGNDELAQVILECGVNIHHRATGTFFLPRDQAHDKPKKETNYEGLAYLGEYHLAWAACQANETLYNLLLEKGADPDAQDSFGNTVLHMVVVTNRMGMFGYALRHPMKSANPAIVNNAELTCLTLSCKLGRDDLFQEMLELSCKEFWRYSNICCSAYPLGALDSIRPSGQTNWGSAVMIILAGTKEEHLNMLEGGIIAKLLEEKWKTFAFMLFVKKFATIWIQLGCLSCALYNRPHYDKSLLMGIKPGTGEPDSNAIIRYCFEIATILGTLEFVVIQQAEEIKNSGINSFYRNLKGTPAKLIYTLGCFFLLAAIPARFLQLSDEHEIYYRQIEETLMVVAIPGIWFYLMFFAGAIKLTGPFVTMVFNMITGDMFTFSIIYIIILFGFSQAFYFMEKVNYKSPGLYNSYPTTWVALFQMTLGEYSYEDLREIDYPGMMMLFFVVFQVLMPILLLNMLIAMMGNTYAIVNEKSEKEFLKQWAKVIMSMERSAPPDKAKHYLEEYSLKLGDNLRGVMVIKSKDKTRARQRKGALSNWKKTGKTIIKYLKKRKMTGDDLRREMWVHDEAATPKAARKKKGKGYDVAIPGITVIPDPVPLEKEGQKALGQQSNPNPTGNKNQPPPLQPPPQPTNMYGTNPALMAQDKFMMKPSEGLNPQDRWLQKQLETLQEYYKLSQEYEAMKRRQQQQKGGSGNQQNSDPGVDASMLDGLQPAYIGPDPHTLDCSRRKKTREEFQQELFLRKRSRKNMRLVNFDSIDLSNLEHDSDFISDDEDFFVTHSHRNGGFQPDEHQFHVEDEFKDKKANPEKLPSIQNAGAENGHAVLVPNGDAPHDGSGDEDAKKEKKKKKKEKKEKKEKKKKKKKDKDEDE